MDGGFITGFLGFAAAEATQHPDLAGPLGRLVDALESVESVESVDRNSGPTLPVVDEHLDVALSAATGPSGELLREVVHQVGWAQPYPEHIGEPDMDALRASYAYAPIVGARDNGPAPLWTSNDVFAGVVLQGPGVVYPSHVHKAAELYWVASGTARWQRGDEWTSHGPGALIFHDTGVRHATVTGHEATLLLFAWVSDPASVPVIIRH